MNEQQKVTHNRVYRVDPSRAAWRQVDREGVVLDLHTSVYFGLNESAGVLWPRLIAGSTHTELVDALIAGEPQQFDRDQAADEVSSFLQAVDAEGLFVAG